MGVDGVRGFPVDLAHGDGGHTLTVDSVPSPSSTHAQVGQPGRRPTVTEAFQSRTQQRLDLGGIYFNDYDLALPSRSRSIMHFDIGQLSMVNGKRGGVFTREGKRGGV